MLIGHNIEGIISTCAIIGQEGVKVWKRRQLAFEDWICLMLAFSALHSERLNRGFLTIAGDLGSRFLGMKNFGFTRRPAMNQEQSLKILKESGFGNGLRILRASQAR